ncbi:MAG: hypothetical protein CMP49_03125 [Flavobacteriales bacterium]|nr:hypothetical protein [Flavobacteriales bacterium]|tara:strand:+ start:614 stop:1543 length:930 start_codon:yes stop_codon:yes gene_type:complete
MKKKIEKSKRLFIKTLMGLGILSIFPFKLKAFEITKDCVTSSDLLGPFYIEDSPNVSILTPPEITSDFLLITGTVYANDCITPIPNAVVDIWHANKGTYDQNTNSYLDANYDDNYATPPYYRAKIYTDSNGNYAYQTIMPGKYENGSYYRPSHIHYKSSFLEENELTTQLYFEGDSSLEIDPWSSNPSAQNRIISLTTDENNNLNGVFDIVLNTNPSNVPTINIRENILIRSIHPNPINNNSTIYFHTNNRKLNIEICNINGQIISKKINFQKSTIKLSTILPKNINSGIYILRIKSSDGYSDAKRFII